MTNAQAGSELGQRKLSQREIKKFFREEREQASARFEILLKTTTKVNKRMFYMVVV